MLDINWSVDFDITVNGISATLSDLPEDAQQKILKDIAGDSYSGTFTGEGDFDELRKTWFRDGISD